MKFLTDENFEGAIFRGLLCRKGWAKYLLTQEISTCHSEVCRGIFQYTTVKDSSLVVIQCGRFRMDPFGMTCMEVVLFIPGFFHYRQQKLRTPSRKLGIDFLRVQDVGLSKAGSKNTSHLYLGPAVVIWNNTVDTSIFRNAGSQTVDTCTYGGDGLGAACRYGDA